MVNNVEIEWLPATSSEPLGVVLAGLEAAIEHRDSDVSNEILDAWSASLGR